MDTKRHCQHCGKPLGPDAIEGLCPECLMKMGLGIGTETSGAAQSKRAFIPPTLADLAPKFPQFELLGLIGQGGMGAVYKARQKQLDRLVALKILPPGIGDDPAFADRFAREARAMAKLNHPGIVTIHDFGHADGLYYLIMELVDGVSLGQLIQAGRISPREALAIVPQICDALQYAHDHGIVHRDIKPENILLDRQGRVKVADFGLAKLIGGGELVTPGPPDPSPNLTQAGKIMGTPRYMAPEQVEHPGEVDHRADIYALGLVFYQMLTGELPGRRIQPPSRKVQIDVRLDEVVLRALEHEPARRYQQVSQIRTDVETIAQSSASNPRQLKPQPEKRSPLAVQILLGIAVVMGLLVGLRSLILHFRGTVPAAAVAQYETLSQTLDNLDHREQELLKIFTPENRMVKQVAAEIEVHKKRKQQLEAEYPLLLRPHQRASTRTELATPLLAMAAYQRDVGTFLDALGTAASSNSASFAISEHFVKQVVRKFDAHEPLALGAYDRDSKLVGHGALQAVDNHIDPATGTMECKARLVPEDDQILLPGKFLSIHMLLEVKRGAILVPMTALRIELGDPSLWVIGSDDILTRRTVKAGKAVSTPTFPTTKGLENLDMYSPQGRLLEIESGLLAGEVVVTNPHSKLRAGEKVAYTLVEPEQSLASKR